MLACHESMHLPIRYFIHQPIHPSTNSSIHHLYPFIHLIIKYIFLNKVMLIIIIALFMVVVPIHNNKHSGMRKTVL